MKKRIVITGWGNVSPYGLSNEDFENSYCSEIAYSLKNDWEHVEIESQYFGRIPDFDILKELPSLKPPFPNRYSSLGLLACLNALKDAGLVNRQDLLDNTGLILSTSLGASSAIQSFLSKLYTKGPDRLSPFVFSKATSNSILGDVSRILQIKGPGSLVYGEDSITYGIDLILNNHSDIILCGGVDEITEPSVLLAKKMNRLLKPNKNETIVENVKNDLSTDKFIFSETSSVIVIESIESALARNANIYAEIIDYKQFNDSLSNKVIFERSTKDLKKYIKEFLIENNVKISDKILFYGSACLPWHIKSYEWGAIESLSFNFTYANTKVSIGECLSGSNNSTITAAILSYKNNRIANVFKEAKPLQDIPSNISLNDPCEEESFTTITNTFSLGGNNTLLMLKKYDKDE